MTGRPGWNVLFSSKRKLLSRDFQKKEPFFPFLFFCDWIVSRLKEVRRLSGNGSGKATSCLFCFLHRSVSIKPRPALCCRLKWALDRDEALPPHDLQQGVLFYHGGVSGDDLSLAQNGKEVCKWSQHADCVQIERRWKNVKEEIIRLIRTKRACLFFFFHEWSHQMSHIHSACFLHPHLLLSELFLDILREPVYSPAFSQSLVNFPQSSFIFSRHH